MLILQVALPVPLRRIFDYLAPKNWPMEKFAQPLQAGMRVKVPFGRQQMIGVLLNTANHTDIPASRLKHALSILDETPLISPDILELLHWASRYYQHPMGEVVCHALPKLLRQGDAARISGVNEWSLTETGKAVVLDDLKRSPRQAELMQQLQTSVMPLSAEAFEARHQNWRPTLGRLIEKSWVQISQRNRLTGNPRPQAALPLNASQQDAVDTVSARLNQFQCFLLNGITGSGKTEVYLHLIQQVLDLGQQAMVLVPEIGLTPQLVQRFTQRLACPVAVMHSGLNDSERLNAWLAAKNGDTGVIIGTRSALFTPLHNPGLFILDEEHDLSFKQQDGFRYNARDLAIVRAHKANVPIILGSATPSLESLRNVELQRSSLLSLPQRAGSGTLPGFRLLDIRSQKLQHGLSVQMLTSIKQHLEQGTQALLFLNRRGFAPVLMCHDCGWHARCQRCDAHMTVHQRSRRLRCHHCGSERPIYIECPECKSENLDLMGVGTERVEEVLQQHFPDYPVLRIDRDSTRRKGSMQAMLDTIHQGKPMIMLGTQMLAKGHHFPNVTLVGLLDADYGLFSADFRATERMGQLILQVAGRAGRAEHVGEVLIQTHQPENSLLHYLLRHDYDGFAQALMTERRESAMPPYSHLALLRAEAPGHDTAMQFLNEARQLMEQKIPEGLWILGPVPAPMERRAGRYRAQLLIQHHQRHELQQWLAPLLQQLENSKNARQVRWSIDVDPMEMY